MCIVCRGYPYKESTKPSAVVLVLLSGGQELLCFDSTASNEDDAAIAAQYIYRSNSYRGADCISISFGPYMLLKECRHHSIS